MSALKWKSGALEHRLIELGMYARVEGGLEVLESERVLEDVGLGARFGALHELGGGTDKGGDGE